MHVAAKRKIINSFLKSTDYFKTICQKLRGIGKSKKIFLEVLLMKRRIALLLASAMLLTSAVAGLTSCSDDEGGSGSGKKGHVYYLNFKPEVDKQWQELAAKYTEETGVQVDVVTAADNKYMEKLTTEIAKEDAPTLFQISGVADLATWDEYCYDLTGSDPINELSSTAYALKNSEGKIKGLGYVSECFGIIVRKDLLEKAGHTLDEIKNFETLKAVAEDITARKEELGFSAFTTPSLGTGNTWRLTNHLSNIPLFYEFKADGLSADNPPATIKGTYLDQYRQMIDLYLNNATVEPSVATGTTVDDARAEFIDGKAVFFQNGDWEYGNITKDGKVTNDQLAMIPMYIGVEGEENQGICAGTQAYWAVNGDAAEEDIQATLDFMKWLMTSDTATTALADEMGFSCTFKSAKTPQNYLDKFNNDYAVAGKEVVTWAFTAQPSENYQLELGSALSSYAVKMDDASWGAVKAAFVDNWATEYAAAHE